MRLRVARKLQRQAIRHRRVHRGSTVTRVAERLRRADRLSDRHRPVLYRPEDRPLAWPSTRYSSRL